MVVVVPVFGHCDALAKAYSEIPLLSEENKAEEYEVEKGSSLKLVMVAEGSADIYPRLAPTMEWKDNFSV